MRTARTALTALLLAGALSVAAAAQPPAPALMQPALNAAVAVGVGIQGRTVGVDFFYSNLAPYGYWVNRPSYGWSWVPRHVRHGWRPYSSGRWAYTDYGWTWVSAEPFGWATYHYGRWALDPDYGWSWVPGTDWGPAWVSWQQGDGYLGWAPLPPQVGWSAGVGFGGFDFGVIDPGWYCFVPERSFLAVNVGGFIAPSFRNVTIIHNTTNITNVRFENGRVFNGSVRTDRIAQVTGQPVRQMRLAAAGDPRTARVSGNTVAMFRPAAVVRRANALDPPRVAPRSVATGRTAQQLVRERRPMAAQFRQAGAGTRTAQAPTGAGTRTAQAPTRRQSQQQAQARRQALPAGRHQPSAQARSQANPPGRHQGTAQARRQAAPMGRGQQQALGHRQVTPPPQRTRGGVAPRQGVRSQQVHHYTPPPQRAGRVPPSQARQGQIGRQSAPPPRAERQSAPPPQRQAQAQRPAPPPRQAQAQRPAPPPRQAHGQPPPPRRQQGSGQGGGR